MAPGTRTTSAIAEGRYVITKGHHRRCGGAVRISRGSDEGVRALLVSYRSGDMWSPRVNPTEALNLETAYFVECVTSGQRPFNDGHAGLRVVRLLEAAHESIRRRGQIVELAPRSRRRRAARASARSPIGDWLKTPVTRAMRAAG